MPVFADRGVGFLTSPLSSNPPRPESFRARRHGNPRGDRGGPGLSVRPGHRDLPRGICRRHQAHPLHPDQHPQPGRRPVSRCYGLLGLSVFVAFMNTMDDNGSGRNILAGGITSPCWSSHRHHHLHRGAAIRAEHNSRGRLRRGCVALGGDSRQLVIPSAAPGILTGTVLALSRASARRAPSSSSGPSWIVLRAVHLDALHRQLHRPAGHRVRLVPQAAGGLQGRRAPRPSSSSSSSRSSRTSSRSSFAIATSGPGDARHHRRFAWSTLPSPSTRVRPVADPRRPDPPCRSTSTLMRRGDAAVQLPGRERDPHREPGLLLLEVPGGARTSRIEVRAAQITALIGPSGCGKSTVLRCLNRMNDLIAARVEGKVLFHGEDLYEHRHVDPVDLRRRIGMVFQKPNPFPKSHLRQRGLRPADQRAARATWTSWSRQACGARRCGTRSRTSSSSPAWPSRAASSSGCASRGPWPPARRSS